MALRLEFPSVHQKFPVPLGLWNRTFHPPHLLEPEITDRPAYLFDHLLMNLRISHDAAFSDLPPPRLELRLCQHHDPALGMQKLGQCRQNQRHRDETDITGYQIHGLTDDLPR